jgi:hypothetical protein
MPPRIAPDYELAGDHMKMVEHDDGSMELTFNREASGRVCGTCTLCCTLVPVPVPLNKAAGQRCQYARFGKGCSIYADRPVACATWACRWLIDETTAGLRRPDRSHYVIDMTLDFIVRQNDDGSSAKVPVIQIWCDPAHRNAHRDPELRAWLVRQAERWRCAALVRFDNRTGIVLAAPPLCEDGAWHEFDDRVMMREEEHSPEEIEAVVGGMVDHAASAGA